MSLLPPTLRTISSNRFLFVAFFSLLATLVILLAPVAYFVVKYDLSVRFLLDPVAVAMFVLAFVYGLVRATRYHPALDKDYRQWLERTPWTPRHPLPKGPLHLVWSDLFILMGMAGVVYLFIFCFTSSNWFYALGPFVAFAVAITFFWSSANVITGQYAQVYLAIAVPVLFGILRVPLGGYALCPFITAGIAWYGVRRSLDTFPWPDRDLGHNTFGLSQHSAGVVGWPFRDLLQPYDEFTTSKSRASVEAALVGGWVWLVMDAMTFGGAVNMSDVPDELGPIFVFVTIGAFLVASARLYCYGPVICQKLCWGNRVANRQWIIARHDQIFVVPLLMIVVGGGLPQLLFHGFGASLAVSCGLTVSAVILMARAVGPSLRELQFTGTHSQFGQRLTDRRETVAQAMRNRAYRESVRISNPRGL